MYLYMFVTIIMLVNMLIAMMAKTFDNVFEVQEQYFLYLKARQTATWLGLPAAPPPLNLLRLPYSIVSTLYTLLSAATTNAACGRHGRRGRLPTGPLIADTAFHETPQWKEWKARLRHPNRSSTSEASAREASAREGSAREASAREDDPIDVLVEQMSRFISERSSDVVREDRFKHELFTRLGTSFEALTRETAASRARIDELVKQLDALGSTGSAASQRREADRT